jgi:hypothetical protein
MKEEQMLIAKVGLIVLFATAGVVLASVSVTHSAVAPAQTEQRIAYDDSVQANVDYAVGAPWDL